MARGLTKVTGQQKHAYVLVEPSPKCMSIFVPGNTSELIPGGSGIVIFRNFSGRHITLQPNTKFGIVTAANIVPSIQIPDKHDLSESEKVQCQSAQADLSEEIQQEETDPDDILLKVDLTGIDDWDLKVQQAA